MNNATKGKWFRFNDTVVEEFEMNDAALEAECFGGSYKPKIYDDSHQYLYVSKVFIWIANCISQGYINEQRHQREMV